MRFDSEVMDGIVPDDMPEELLEHDAVRKLLHNVDGWAMEFDRWIDPNSEYYEESLWEERVEGFARAKEDVLGVLRDAIYDEDMFGKTTTLGELYDTFSRLDAEARANG